MSDSGCRRFENPKQTTWLKLNGLASLEHTVSTTTSKNCLLLELASFTRTTARDINAVITSDVIWGDDKMALIAFLRLEMSQ